MQTILNLIEFVLLMDLKEGKGLVSKQPLTRLQMSICGASSRKPYNVGEKIFFFLADLNSPDSKL